VYRDSSKSVQVLQAVKSDSAQRSLDSIKDKHKASENDPQTISMANVMAGAHMYTFVSGGTEEKCPECGNGMIAGSGCFTCPKCAYSKCG
jgi:hypothetical protein